MKILSAFKSKRLTFILGIILAMLCSTTGYGQANGFLTSAFCNGEWLKYKVKWGFIRLGTIEIFQEQTAFTCSPAFTIKMHAKSAKLPFIKVFFINQGILNPDQPTLQHFSITIGKKENHVTTYHYNPASKTVEMTTVLDEALVRQDSLICVDDLYDALGLFMMTRCLSGSELNTTLNSIVDFKVSQTHLNFSSELDTLKVAAFDSAQTAAKFSGNADWVGKAYGGVTGPFKGWISRDDRALLLKVKVKIFLGSITLELEDFRRPSMAEGHPASSIANQ